MNLSKNPNPQGVVLLRRKLSLIAQCYAWLAASVAALLVVLVFLDIFLSAFGIYTLDEHLLVTLPVFQAVMTWLLGNMSVGFVIHHIVRTDTRIDLALMWGFAALGCVILYWH